jgi:hypothetical protein
MDDPMQVDQPLLGLPFDHQNEFKEGTLVPQGALGAF